MDFSRPDRCWVRNHPWSIAEQVRDEVLGRKSCCIRPVQNRVTMNTFAERALKLFPAGSNGEYNFPRDFIPVVERGEGCRIWDCEGREFLDLTMAWGAALVGHAHPQVIEAAARQARLGVNFAAINKPAVLLAERIQSASPGAERVRFVTSGSEATLLALRVAQAATGRPKFLKFEGAYHGQHPVGVASMVAVPDQPSAAANSAGTGAPWIEQHVLAAPFNDLVEVQRIASAFGNQIAAIIVEPFQRCIQPVPGFLAGLRELTRRYGIVLIFDEVVTGFRLAVGGAQEFYDVRADLVAYGKALGGGFPIGALVGRADLMQVLEEHRLPGPPYVWSASTGGGNPVSAAAALATLEILSGPDVYSELFLKGKLMREGMEAALSQQGETGQILGIGPLAQVAFSASPVTDQRTWMRSDRNRARALMLELLRSGVFLNPMGTKLYLSLMHDTASIKQFLRLFEAGLQATRNV